MTLFSFSSQRKALKLFWQSQKQEGGRAGLGYRSFIKWVSSRLLEWEHQSVYGPGDISAAWLGLLNLLLPSRRGDNCLCLPWSLNGLQDSGEIVLSWSNYLFKNKLMILTSLAAILLKRERGQKANRWSWGLDCGEIHITSCLLSAAGVITQILNFSKASFLALCSSPRLLLNEARRQKTETTASGFLPEFYYICVNTYIHTHIHTYTNWKQPRLERFWYV